MGEDELIGGVIFPPSFGAFCFGFFLFFFSWLFLVLLFMEGWGSIVLSYALKVTCIKP